ncbi:MAG: hypothetical protein JO231_14305 [Acidobacteria bacterium]|nr:hypothetical protein [Acidobacteriota bacterium]
MPIERAIAEGRFAFGRNSRSRQMEPPPNMPSFESLPPRLIALFEAAFSGTSSRPTARDWARALDTVQSEIQACSVEPVHKYYKALTQCTWCELESAAGVYFFIGVISNIGTFDLESLWAEIVRLTGLPYEAPLRPTVHAIGAPPSDSDLRKRPKALAAKIVSLPLLLSAAALSSNAILAFGFFLAVIFIIALPLPGAAERRRRLKRVREFEEAWTQAYRRAEAEVSLEPLLVKHDELRRLRTAYEALPARRQAELQEMTLNAQAIQLQRYLQHQLIRSHSISDIGPKRKATLAMWGIATAADVTIQSLAPVQGFGPTLKTKLLAWRAVLERRFVFNAKEAIPKPDRDAFEYRWQRRKLDLEQQLSAGAEHARRINSLIRQRRVALAKALEAPALDWAQARADLEAIDLAIKGERT